MSDGERIKRKSMVHGGEESTPPPSLRDQMARYLTLIKLRDENQALVKSAQANVNTIHEEMGTIYQVLKKSVQPRCGSATQPPRRIFTDGHYTTLIVEWSEALNAPIVEVMEPER